MHRGINMLDNFGTVVLSHDVKKYGLEAGDIGTVVHSYSGEKAIEAEFLTAEGKTVAVLTLDPNDIRKPAKNEILHVRESASFA